MRQLRNVLRVLHRQLIRMSRTHIPGHRRSTAREDELDVFPKAAHFAGVARPKPFPEAHQKKKRANSPGDPKHGQERAQFVRPKNPKGLSNDVESKSHTLVSWVE